MKIGIDISQVVYQGTGVATYTSELVTALLAHDKKNEYVLFGSTLRRQRELQGFISRLGARNITQKIHHFPPTLLNVIFNRLHAVNIESFIGDVDIFHTSDWTEPRAKAAKVTTIHDLIVYKYPEYLNRRIVETQKQKLAWVSQESKAVIADSESTKKDIMEYLGIPESRIQVVYLGVDTDFVPQSDQKIELVKKQFGIEGNYVLCVGTREPRKNLHRIIEAFASLQPKGQKLVICGNPGWGDDVDTRNNIHILNFVSKEELVALYSGASCFVYPSLYEGFGLPILEAFACGTPVVTSKKGSLKELARDFATVVNPESVEEIAIGIKKVLNYSSSARNEVVKKARQYVAEFTWEETAKKTLEVYKGML